MYNFGNSIKFPAHQFQQGSSAQRMHYAIITGNKRNLRHKDRKMFRRLNLYHLLTPSGLHLSIVLSPFKLLKNYQFTGVLLLLNIFLYLIPKYFSLKRTALFHLLRRLTSFNAKSCFLLVCLFEVSFGSFLQSPGSFIYSFIFWGIILFSSNHKERLLSLFFANVGLSMLNSEAQFFLNLFLTPIITSIFTILYPLLFICFFVSQSWPAELLYKIIQLANYIVTSLGEIHGNIFILLSFFVITQWKKLLIVCLLLNMFELNPLSQKAFTLPNKEINIKKALMKRASMNK